MAKERKKAKIILFVAGPFANSAAAALNVEAKKRKMKRYNRSGSQEPVDAAVNYLLENCTTEKETFEKELHKLLERHITEDIKEDLKHFRKDDNDLMIVTMDSMKEALRWHGAVRKKLPDLVSCVVVSIYKNRLTVYRNNWKESIHDSSAEKIMEDVDQMAIAQTSRKILLSAKERMLIREAVTEYRRQLTSLGDDDTARELLGKLGD